MEQGSRHASQRRRIVVGVSGSLGSIAALHHAVAEARRTDGEVLAVLAWEPVGGEYGYRRAPCPPLLAAWRDAAVARLREALEGVVGVGCADVPLHAEAVRGEAGEALVRTADRSDDLLVVGAAGTGRLRRLLRPSVTAHCVKRAECPVLVVPKPALQRELETLQRRNSRHLPMVPIPSRIGLH
ncbi:nucleotide-binding universal stress UspA family protein [Kitasatospora sp. MAP12-15]|uniref:universal stress protein n=1 Tax=unclassified Kitasatospora TaxID=2633591 RepID=UPI002474757E|nr:universal stress protein [Kitasatospora sp. MAP12-44]MDH6109352.1 nucleotide-binding universal stress UspA family protein [Kitasatospora sp. MAP12-44]